MSSSIILAEFGETNNLLFLLQNRNRFYMAFKLPKFNNSRLLSLSCSTLCEPIKGFRFWRRAVLFMPSITMARRLLSAASYISLRVSKWRQPRGLFDLWPARNPGDSFCFLRLTDKKNNKKKTGREWVEKNRKGGVEEKKQEGEWEKMKRKSFFSLSLISLFFFFTRSPFLPCSARLLLQNLSLHSSSFDTSFSFADSNCLPPAALPAGGHRVEHSLATPENLEAGPSTSPEIVVAVSVWRTHYWNLLSRFNRGHAGCLCN